MCMRLQAPAPGLLCSWQIKNWHLKNLPPRIGYVFKLNRIRVDQPIIIHLPMTKHLFISSFWVIQNVRGVLFQAIEIIFEMQRKRCNEKNNKTKNNLSNLQNMGFFSLFGPLLLSNLIILFFLFILNDLKCYKSATWSSANHIWTLIATEQHTKTFLNVQKSAFVL